MRETIEAAYIYAFPLVLMDATRAFATNTEEVVPGKAPVNQFMHGAALANAQFKNVVSPNVDTVYSQVWYDLSEEPIVYVLPKRTASARCRCLTPGRTPLPFLIRPEPMPSRFLPGTETCRMM